MYVCVPLVTFCFDVLFQNNLPVAMAGAFSASPHENLIPNSSSSRLRKTFFALKPSTPINGQFLASSILSKDITVHLWVLTASSTALGVTSHYEDLLLAGEGQWQVTRH